MTDEKWIELKATVKNQFDVEVEAEEVIQKDDVGHEIVNNIERLIFETPQGMFKVERTTRPTILDKKVHYSHTSGSKGMVEYILSPDEVSHKLTVYKKDQDSEKWEELNLNEGFKF